MPTTMVNFLVASEWVELKSLKSIGSNGRNRHFKLWSSLRWWSIIVSHLNAQSATGQSLVIERGRVGVGVGVGSERSTPASWGLHKYVYYTYPHLYWSLCQWIGSQKREGVGSPLRLRGGAAIFRTLWFPIWKWMVFRCLLGFHSILWIIPPHLFCDTFGIGRIATHSICD